MSTPAAPLTSQNQMRDTLLEIAVRDLLGPSGGPREEVDEPRVREREVLVRDERDDAPLDDDGPDPMAEAAACPKTCWRSTGNSRVRMSLRGFLPEAAIAEVPRPESIPNLDNLSDVPGAGQNDLSGLGDTTGLGDTSSTVLDPTASTVVATASTVAAPASTVAATTPTTKG